MEFLLEQMQRTALRLMLAIAFVNACVLSCVAVLIHGADAPVQTAIAAMVAVTVAALPFLRGARFAADLTRAWWLPLAGGCLGAIALVLAPASRSILFAAFLTPVGVAVLADDRKAALSTTGVLTCGYILAAAQPAAHSSLGVALGDIGPAFAVILGGLVPAALATGAINARATRVLEWRDPADVSRSRQRPGRPGIAREHDAAILHGVLNGASSRVIAAHIATVPSRVRDRIHVLAREHGVRSRRELAKLLAERAVLNEPADERP